MNKITKTVVMLLICLTASVVIELSAPHAAEIKTLDSFTPATVERHLSGLAESANAANIMMQRSFNKFASGMAVTTAESIAESLRSLDAVEKATVNARKASAAVSDYVTDNRGRFPDALSRIVPLKDLYQKIESPYFDALIAFFAVSRNFLTYAGANFAAIRSN